MRWSIKLLPAFVRPIIIIALFYVPAITITHAQWTNANGPFGGTVITMVVKGSTIFVGAIDGIFASSDNGISWRPSGLSGQLVLALAISGNSIMAGTVTSGIYISNDDGVTWATSNTGLTNLFAEAIAVSGTHIFVGTISGVYASINNGVSWTFKGLENKGIVSFSTSGGKIFAGTASDGLFVSSDNGDNWSPTSLTNVSIVSLASFGNTMFVGAYGGFYRSTDNGNNWTLAGSGVIQTIQSIAMSGTTLIAGTSGDGIMISNDNGSTFTKTGLSGQSIQSLLVNGGVILAGSGADDGIYSSSDNGATWKTSNQGFTNHWIYSLLATGNNVIAGSGVGGIFRSTDNGGSWKSVITKVPGQTYVSIRTLALCKSGNNIIAGTSTGGVIISQDQGQTWSSTGLTEGIASLATSGNNVFAAEADYGISVSHDNGESWTPVGSITHTANSLLIVGSKIYAGTAGGGVLLSMDNGGNWSSINTGLTNLYVNSLAKNGNTLFAGTNGSGIFISYDDGSNWVPANGGLENFQIFALAVYNEIVVAGTANGIYMSSNNGLSWEAFGMGLQNQVVLSISNNSDFIFAGTLSSVYTRQFLFVDQFFPVSGVVGATVTIIGEFFSLTPSDNVVQFNGISATVISSTSTSLTVMVPTTATTGKVSVTIGSQTAATITNFTVLPSITSFSPDSGPAGTTVTITGEAFSATPSESIVQFNGVSATVISSTSTSLTVIVPTIATTGKVSVTIGGQTATTLTNFIVLPSITSFSPVSGAAGTTVTITGTAFSASAFENIVQFNGNNAVVTSSTTTSIITTVPNGALVGSGLITVTVSGQKATSQNTFCISPPKPVITSSGVNTLSSSASSGNQWFLNGDAITNATNQILIISDVGTYTVQVTDNDCKSVISDGFVVVVTGDIKRFSTDHYIELYPNPSTSFINISLEKLVIGKPATIRIFDVLGHTISEQEGVGGNTTRVDITNYTTGIYFVKVKQSGNLYNGRFTKQ